MFAKIRNFSALRKRENRGLFPKTRVNGLPALA